MKAHASLWKGVEDRNPIDNSNNQYSTREERRDSESDKKPRAVRTLFFSVLLDWNWTENRNRKWRAFD